LNRNRPQLRCGWKKNGIRDDFVHVREIPDPAKTGIHGIPELVRVREPETDHPWARFMRPEARLFEIRRPHGPRDFGSDAPLEVRRPSRKTGLPSEIDDVIDTGRSRGWANGSARARTRDTEETERFRWSE